MDWILINCAKADKGPDALHPVVRRVDVLTRKYNMEAEISSGVGKRLENIVRGKRSGKLLCGNEVKEIRVVGRRGWKPAQLRETYSLHILARSL